MDTHGNRSDFPDLVFPDICAARAKSIGANFGPGPRPALDRLTLDRVTLFVTHRCNLRCRYCNGPHLNRSLPAATRRDLLRTDLAFPLFERLVRDWREHGLRYLHLTGGEPTLHRDLPAMVAYAVRHGMLVSLTTNGLAGPEAYRALVENGLYEIRLSIDAVDERYYDDLVGIKGAFARVGRHAFFPSPTDKTMVEFSNLN